MNLATDPRQTIFQAGGYHWRGFPFCLAIGGDCAPSFGGDSDLQTKPQDSSFKNVNTNRRTNISVL